MNEVTIIISPRDRYSGLRDCIEQLYRCTEQRFTLWVLDLGYPAELMRSVRELLADKADARVIELGLCTPMDALREVRAELQTPRVVLLDNDSRVSPGWLPPLLAAMEPGVGVVSPLVLERDGLDKGAALRNHLYTAELRMVDVGERSYLIEQKHYRRTPAAEIPRDRSSTCSFELHCVMFDARTFKAIELPSMVVREHLDMALQVLGRGEEIVAEPASVISFDNLATRMNLDDMHFFFHRWNRHLTEHSSRLFERRWGYRFYSEHAMYTWVFRRKTFLLARWIGLPAGAANFVTKVAKRLFCRDWDPLRDPDGASRLVSESGALPQRDHAIV